MKINVIGACNIDISATPYNQVKLHDSNPGKIKLTLGGVGRNIAHNLALLNQNVKMFTALSTDSNGELIRKSCKELNINIVDAIISDSLSQSVYLCVNDEKGDMLVGSSDMDIVSLISIDYIKEKIAAINDCDALVFDTNLDEDTIEYIINNVKVNSFVEMVSANKCVKIANILKRNDKVNIYMVKANKYEAEVLGNREIKNEDDLNIVSAYLHSKGIKNVCITLGELGAYYSTENESFITPNKEVNIINATGAGDAFFAGMIYGYSKQETPQGLVNYGLSAAKIALESISAVSEEMNESNINKNK